MKVIDQYIGKTCLAAISIVLLVLLALGVLTVIVEQIDNVGDGYTFAEMMIYTVWMVPGLIEENLPFAVLIGCLLGMGVLATSSELTVMRSSGVSIIAIMFSVLRPVLVVMVFGILVGELAAYTDRYAESYRILALKKNSSNRSFSENQVWSREDNEFIRFETVLPNGKVYGLVRYGFNETYELYYVVRADEATYEGDGWLMENVSSYIFRDGQYMRSSKPTTTWKTEVTPDVLIYVASEPENLSIQQLFHYSEFLHQQEIDNRSYLLEFWRKLSKPLEIFGLMLVALSFVFGPLRKATMGYRIFSGVIVAIVFRAVQNIAGSSSLVYGFEPLLGVLLPIGLCILFGLVLLKRVR
jgi:lipopolysaccharide export system permease protein